MPSGRFSSVGFGVSSSNPDGVVLLDYEAGVVVLDGFVVLLLVTVVLLLTGDVDDESLLLLLQLVIPNKATNEIETNNKLFFIEFSPFINFFIYSP